MHKGPRSIGDKPAIGRRLAALLAIAGLVGALVAVGFAVIRGDAWRLPLVLVAVAAAVVGLWYALSRRGAPSWVGMLVAGAGLVTLVVVILTADYRGLPFVVAVALILVSASAARYALGRDSSTLRAESPAGTVVPPAAHPVLIMNPKSGGGKVERLPSGRRVRRAGDRTDRARAR